jgi:hypothetical protein
MCLAVRPPDTILEEDHPMTFYQSLVPFEQLVPEKKNFM